MKNYPESHWSCSAHGTSFLFPQWDDHNDTRELLVQYCSRDQFPFSPVKWPQWNKERSIGPVLLTGPVTYFPTYMTTIKQAESNWSCLAHGTSFLFPQWDDDNETNREPLVLYRSRDQFPISPVRLPQWNRESLVLYRSRDQFPISPVRWPHWIKQTAIGSVSLTGPVSYFSSGMTTMKQTESHWSCVAYGTSFLFLKWDDHNEKKTKKKTKKQRAIGPVSVTGPISYFSSEMTTITQTEIHWSCVAQGTSFPFSPVRWPQWNKHRAIGPVSLTGPVSYFPSEMTTLKQTESHWFCVAHGTSFLFP